MAKAPTFPEIFPTLCEAASALTKDQLDSRANKEFQVARPNNKDNLVVAFLFTFAKRHVGNEAHVGMDALNSKLTTPGKAVVSANPTAAREEWVRLISMFEEVDAATPAGCAFLGPETPLRAFIERSVRLEPLESAVVCVVARCCPTLVDLVDKHSGMTDKQLEARSNASCRPANPTRREAAKGLLLTAAKRHVGNEANEARHGFEALRMLLTAEGNGALAAAEAGAAGKALAAEWLALVTAVSEAGDAAKCC